MGVWIGVLAAVLVGMGLWAAQLRSSLSRVRADIDGWRARFQAEQLERARSEAQANRAAGLETELHLARERWESLGAQKARLEAIAERVPALEERLTALAQENSRLNTANATLSTQQREQTLAHEQKLAALTDVRGGIEKDLKALAQETLRANQGTFLELANQVFEKHKVGAEGELEARQKAVEALVAPLQTTLQSFGQKVDELERARAEAYGALSSELRAVAETQNAVRTETSKLVQALRAAPKTRGRWGEHTLRNVLELSGLSPYCDFSAEESFERDDGKLRPDVVIRLPGGRHLVVDAKTSMSAYLDAIEAVDEVARKQFLVLHAGQLRTHMRQLAAKAYWDGLTVTPDFVVMFIPGDNFYAAALEQDPSLFEDAAAQRVILVTPSTLIALAKAVAFGWRQEKVAENAQRVHGLGRELYKRILVMTEHIENCGSALGKSVKCFNQFIGSLEHSVMPQARRFNELEVEGTAIEIPALEHLDVEPRQLRVHRDFAEGLAAGEAAASASAPRDHR
jgi:DNA recombination protein RmuC